MDYLSLIHRTQSQTIVSTVDAITQQCLELGDAHQVLVNEVYQLVEMTCDEMDVTPTDTEYGLCDTAHEIVGELLDAHSLRNRIKEVITAGTIE